jgi:carboxylesterase type B
MRNLDLDKRYPWKPAEYEVSKVMQSYWVNLIKTGNPNGSGLPNWSAYRADDYAFLRSARLNPKRTATGITLQTATTRQ